MGPTTCVVVRLGHLIGVTAPGGIESRDDPLRDVICTALDVQLID